MIFLLDPLKPHFYYISTGLRGSIFTRKNFHDDFSLFVPIFDLVHAVDAILIPLKQLRASQNRLRNMSDGRENAICSCICIYNISEEKNQMLLAVYTGYVLPPHRSIGLI